MNCNVNDRVVLMEVYEFLLIISLVVVVVGEEAFFLLVREEVTAEEEEEGVMSSALVVATLDAEFVRIRPSATSPTPTVPTALF